MVLYEALTDYPGLDVEGCLITVPELAFTDTAR